MKKIEKELLISKLKENNILLNEEDLDEAMASYNKLMDFVLENNKFIIDNRFAFILTFDDVDRQYFTIFIKVIELQEKNLLNYLDYSFLIYHLKDYLNHIDNFYVIAKFLDVLSCIKIEKDFIKYYICSEPFLIESIINNNMNTITDLNCIPNNYKLIIELYEKIYSEYYDICDKYYQGDKICFYKVIDISYYYFLMNNEFNNDIDHVFSFLNYIYNDLVSAIDKYQLIGETKNYEQVLTYIDSLYKSFENKVRVIK